MPYDWLKALHIIAVIAWMAGMLYLPRLFVYHCEAEPGSKQSETFKVMERRLLRAIINPAMVATWVLGLWLAWDAGLAAENMMLGAWELGVGSCPATVYEQAVARESLGFPEDRFCGWILSFGYPADPADLTRPPKQGGRKSLDEVVHLEQW